MYRLLFFSAVMIFTMQSVVLSPVSATDCADTVYGVSTLRGDAQCPSGGCAGFGAIEVTPPNEFVYGVIDGSVSPQQFLYIKAKLRNLLTRNIGAGTLSAAARYRKRIGYEPDLSADPPTPENIEPNFRASLSAPIAINTLASDLPETFVFDFSSDPIPAGITDLYLIVFFQGEIGDAGEPGAAIGIKNLNEPHHITVWNLTDYFVYFDELRTGESLWNDNEARQLMDEVCPGMDWFVFPEERSDVQIGFNATGSEEPIYVAEFSDLPAGRYGRIIALTEGAFFVSYQRVIPHDGNPGYYAKQFNAVVNQGNGEAFKNTTPARFRLIKTHDLHARFFSCPVSSFTPAEIAKVTELYREVAPADEAPQTATALNFP